MSYATTADLIARYGEAELIQTTDRADPPAQAYDAGVVQQALDDADAIINSYLAAQVAVPIAPPYPPAVVMQACALARYSLWSDRASQRVKDDQAAAVKWLTQVAQGLIPIGDKAPEVVTSKPKSVTSKPIFTEKALKQF